MIAVPGPVVSTSRQHLSCHARHQHQPRVRRQYQWSSTSRRRQSYPTWCQFSCVHCASTSVHHDSACLNHGTVVEYIATAPARSYMAPALAVYAAPVPVVEYIASVPAVSYEASVQPLYTAAAPMYIAPVLVVIAAPMPLIKYIAPVSAVKASVFCNVSARSQTFW